MTLKKYLIPVAVILACALVLFAASAGLAGTEEAREAELFDTLMQQLPSGRKVIQRMPFAVSSPAR